MTAGCPMTRNLRDQVESERLQLYKHQKVIMIKSQLGWLDVARIGDPLAMVSLGVAPKDNFCMRMQTNISMMSQVFRLETKGIASTEGSRSVTKVGNPFCLKLMIRMLIQSWFMCEVPFLRIMIRYEIMTASNPSGRIISDR
jgi:hypothetical protein